VPSGRAEGKGFKGDESAGGPGGGWEVGKGARVGCDHAPQAPQRQLNLMGMPVGTASGHTP
jgi:hypothetical protein